MSAAEWIRLIIGCLFILIGMVIFFTELFGVFHFKYVLNRMHAAAMGDTLGISACLIGLMIFSGLVSIVGLSSLYYGAEFYDYENVFDYCLFVVRLTRLLPCAFETGSRHQRQPFGAL